MTVEIRPLLFKPHRLNGLSDKLLVSHYENNYGGALRRLNAIQSRLAAFDWPAAPVFEINGVKREELIAAGSVILHEIYFDALGGQGGDPTGGLGLAEALERDFGSLRAWHTEFTSMAKALGGGSGWALLVWSDRLGRLVNQWAADHAHGLAGGAPILALDMYEHAYHMDYGANAKAYVDIFMRNVDWKALYTRYEDAAKVGGLRPLEQPEFGDLPSVGVEEVKAMLDSNEPVQVVDARPRACVSWTHEVMQGATWRDPERVPEWVGELSKSDPVVVFCAYGFHVGCKTAIKLRDLGFDAKFMQGGHSAWKAIGGSVKRQA
jgi:superoxide dismutase, Fe-Mn family